MDKLYIVKIYSLDEWGEIEDYTEFFTKTVDEAVELEKIINQKLADLQLTEEFYVELEGTRFDSIETFNEKVELNYLYEYREYLDQEAKEEQERIQRMENEYNSLTDKQKEVYDANMIDISKWNENKIVTHMNGMFSECKDFHTIAMEKAKKA